MEFRIPVTTVKCVTLPDGSNVTQFSEFRLFFTKFRDAVMVTRQSQQKNFEIFVWIPDFNLSTSCLNHAVTIENGYEAGMSSLGDDSRPHLTAEYHQTQKPFQVENALSASVPCTSENSTFQTFNEKFSTSELGRFLSFAFR